METIITIVLFFMFLPTITYLLKGEVRAKANNATKAFIDEVFELVEDGAKGGKK